MLVSAFQLLKLLTRKTSLSPDGPPSPAALNTPGTQEPREEPQSHPWGSFREISLSHELPGMEAWKNLFLRHCLSKGGCFSEVFTDIL